MQLAKVTVIPKMHSTTVKITSLLVYHFNMTPSATLEENVFKARQSALLRLSDAW